MPFNTPTLEQLADQVAGAFRANMKGSDAALWPNNVAVAAKVIAGAAHGLYANLDYISKQINPSTADGPFLIRHAAARGIAQLAPTYATGNILLHGDAAITIPSGVILQRADGVQYQTLAGGITDGSGNLTVLARAVLAGKDGNALAGVVVNLTAPIDRIGTANVVASGGIGAGADLENEESLRSRLLFLLANPPMGGAAHDYVTWGREVNGVTRVWVDPVTLANARSTIAVYFAMDDSYANGIPQSSDVAVVAAYIDARRPAGAVVEVAAPVATVQNIVINALSPNTLVVRNAIAAELAEFFRRQSQVSTLTEPFIMYRSALSEAIAAATGEHNHSLTTPASDVTVANGHLLTLGTITYT